MDIKDKHIQLSQAELEAFFLGAIAACQLAPDALPTVQSNIVKLAYAMLHTAAEPEMWNRIHEAAIRMRRMLPVIAEAEAGRVASAMQLFNNLNEFEI